MKKFLKEKEREYLKSSHRQGKTAEHGDRIKGILMADRVTGRIKEIGGALLLDHETISCHVRKYREYNKLSVNSGGSDRKLSFAQSKELINHLEKSTYLKVTQVLTKKIKNLLYLFKEKFKFKKS